MYDPMPTTDIALLLRHGMLYKKLVASVTKMLDHYTGKNLFRKLNEHSKDLGLKQESIAKQHDSLMDEFIELKHLKNNMDDYIGREKTKKKKESVACLIKKYEVVDKEKNKKWKDENLDR